jgi:outer membrane protein assembly factor BamD
MPARMKSSRLLYCQLLIAAVLLASTLSGCRSRGDEFEDIKGSPEKIYKDARKAMYENNFEQAIQKFEMLEARYPFSEVSKQSQLDLLYSYYKNHDIESAVDQADQFLRENPTHPRVDYAYYIRGLVYFESGLSWLERVFNADISKRPPQEARKAYQSFQTLVERYPASPYAADSRQRLIYLRNRLANYELEVARYSMKRGAYIGAVNRAREIIQTYDGAPAVNDALKILENAYTKLGMDELAMSANAIRKENYSADEMNRRTVDDGPWWRFWD